MGSLIYLASESSGEHIDYGRAEKQQFSLT